MSERLEHVIRNLSGSVEALDRSIQSLDYTTQRLISAVEELNGQLATLQERPQRLSGWRRLISRRL